MNKHLSFPAFEATTSRSSFKEIFFVTGMLNQNDKEILQSIIQNCLATKFFAQRYYTLRHQESVHLTHTKKVSLCNYKTNNLRLLNDITVSGITPTNLINFPCFLKLRNFIKQITGLSSFTCHIIKIGIDSPIETSSPSQPPILCRLRPHSDISSEHNYKIILRIVNKTDNNIGTDIFVDGNYKGKFATEEGSFLCFDEKQPITHGFPEFQLKPDSKRVTLVINSKEKPTLPHCLRYV